MPKLGATKRYSFYTKMDVCPLLRCPSSPPYPQRPPTHIPEHRYLFIYCISYSQEHYDLCLHIVLHFC